MRRWCLEMARRPSPLPGLRTCVFVQWRGVRRRIVCVSRLRLLVRQSGGLNTHRLVFSSRLLLLLLGWCFALGGVFVARLYSEYTQN